LLHITQAAAPRLRAAGFAPERHEERLTYAFVRGNDVVDLPAPDLLGKREKLTTVPPLPPARAGRPGSLPATK